MSVSVQTCGRRGARPSFRWSHNPYSSIPAFLRGLTLFPIRRPSIPPSLHTPVTRYPRWTFSLRLPR